jgi:hypothetical protein
MSSTHGKNQYLSWNSVNISDQISDLSLGQSLDEAETTTFQQTGETYVTGLADKNLEFSGPFDEASGKIYQTILFDYIKGTTRTAVYGPQNNTTGNVSYTDTTAYLTKLSVRSSVTGPVEYSSGVRLNAPTRGTF